MNKIIASIALAIILTTAVTAYAQGAPKLMCVMYPPVACTDSSAVIENKDLVVKFKMAEIYNDFKRAIRK